mgnify:CR=1 FL=1
MNTQAKRAKKIKKSTRLYRLYRYKHNYPYAFIPDVCTAVRKYYCDLVKLGGRGKKRYCVLTQRFYVALV